ncbi:MAG: hypothetical protein ACP5GD_01710 [Candidatus Micrarchaeia archaeon]
MADHKKAEAYLTILAVLIILLVAIRFRAPLLKYYGFYEPDDYYHFSVIRAAIANNFIVPMYLSISGWPAHTIISEPKGLYYTVLAPYFILRFFGISAYQIMRHVALVFGLFDVIGAYFLARYLSKDKLLGLLAMALVALNMGDAARTSTLIFRGDSFVTIFLILALIASLAMMKETKQKKKILLAVLAGFLLSGANFVWNGAPFTTVVMLLFFILLLLFGYTFADTKLLNDAKYMLVMFLVWFAFVSLYKWAYLIMGQTFTGWHFIPIFAVMAIGAYLFDLILKYSKHKRPYERFLIFLLIFAISMLAIYAALPGFVIEVIKSGSFLTLSSNRFAETIQELQPPSYPFLLASFGLQLFLVPMDYPMIWSVNHIAKYWYWLLAIVFAVPYFFMQVFDSGGFAKGRARIMFGYSEALLAILAYFAATAYLQMNAIRFNSLVSVPLSIFAAYTLYWLLTEAKKVKPLFYVGVFLLILVLAEQYELSAKYTAGLSPADEICMPQFFCTNPSNPPVVQALSWLKNNSPSNSVVLTLWPDGSLVEGIANRTSVTDSVGSQNGSKANPFAAWLFNSSPDARFLLTPINGKPNYLLVRYAWLVETGGIYTESGYGVDNYNQTFISRIRSELLTKYHLTSWSQLNQTLGNELNQSINAYIESLYGYGPFNTISETTNTTTTLLTFSGYYINNIEFTGKLVIQTINGTKRFGGFLVETLPNGQSNVSMFSNVILYNILNTSSVVISQSNFTTTDNYTLLVTYSPEPSIKLPINVTGAYLLAPGLAHSNMIKFLYECDYTSCPWNNNIAKLQLVYNNLDTKIFKIVYNESNASIAAIHYT